MSKTVSIVMPAYKAEGTIAEAVRSVLGQTHRDWELIVVADDGGDYEALLERAGIVDPRLRFVSSGGVKTGASSARNVGLDAVDTDYVAVLDADDRFKPQKLALAVQALAEHPIVSTALDVRSADGRPLRTVAAGPSRLLGAGAHKWVNFSMDSMIVWDRRVCDARYDPELPNMTDLDFLMKLYRTSAVSFHLGVPLHDYIKVPTSLSNGEGVTERMIGAKRRLLQRLAEGYYPMADPAARDGFERFLRLSLDAEARYPAARSRNPDLLFEDHIEPMLRGAFVG